MAKTICLDPGHGGKDAGAVNGSRYEKNDNLRIAFALETVLKRQGFNVLLTRKDDSYVSLEERARIANKNSADLFLSLHRNSFSKPDANGIEN
ncbi:MAG: N-acetylmuramoyl-L-alanine amidase, partial [Oscillospiraceae bacterium]